MVPKPRSLLHNLILSFRRYPENCSGGHRPAIIDAVDGRSFQVV